MPITGLPVRHPYDAVTAHGTDGDKAKPSRLTPSAALLLVVRFDQGGRAPRADDAILPA